MRAGQLRHKIKIQAKTTTRDTNGQALEAWTDLHTVFGRIEPLSGRELLNAKAINPEIDHRITVRYVNGITAKNRIAFGSRVFQILSAICPEEKKAELQLMAKEQV